MNRSKKPSKSIFLGWEIKSNPGVLYPLGQIPQSEIDELGNTIVSVLHERSAGRNCITDRE